MSEKSDGSPDEFDPEIQQHQRHQGVVGNIDSRNRLDGNSHQPGRQGNGQGNGKGRYKEKEFGRRLTIAWNRTAVETLALFINPEGG